MTVPAPSTEVRRFDCLLPAGTAINTPVTISMAMPARQVLGIRVRVPPGHNGLTGFNIGSAGQQIIPLAAGTWLVGSDEVFVWDLTNEINSGSWELHGYNLGAYDHHVYVDFTVILPTPPDTSTGPSPVITGLTAPASTPDAATAVSGSAIVPPAPGQLVAVTAETPITGILAATANGGTP